MAKLSINAAPTFKGKVSIPVAGADPVVMEFTFKHRTKDELAEFTSTRKDKTDTESVTDMIVGWEFEEEFSNAAIETMLQNYIGAAEAIFRIYLSELLQAKAKN